MRSFHNDPYISLLSIHYEGYLLADAQVSYGISYKMSNYPTTYILMPLRNFSCVL